MDICFFDEHKKRYYFVMIILLVILSSLAYNWMGIIDRRKIAVYFNYFMENSRISRITFYQALFSVIKNRSKEYLILLIMGLSAYKNILQMFYVAILCIKNTLFICLLTDMYRNRGIILFFKYKMPFFILHIACICFIIEYMGIQYGYNKTGKIKRLFVLGVLVSLEIFLESLHMWIVK